MGKSYRIKAGSWMCVWDVAESRCAMLQALAKSPDLYTVLGPEANKYKMVAVLCFLHLFGIRMSSLTPSPWAHWCFSGPLKRVDWVYPRERSLSMHIQFPARARGDLSMSE
jgi:hypothetical protein